MQQVQIGDTIKVHYKGRLTDGTVFDSSDGGEPLEFEVGSGMMIKGFDDGVKGMEVGNRKTLNIPSDEAYGDRSDEMVVEFPREQFPQDVEVEIGMHLNMTNGSGQVIPVIITEVKEDTVILDANHPLAGEDLIFDIELVSISGRKSLIITP